MEELKNDEGQSPVTLDFPASGEKTDTTFDQRALIEDSKKPVSNDVPRSPISVRSNQNKTLEPSETMERIRELNANKGVIDTAQPIDSVKSAVSKFGGIVDWKAHKVMAIEKHTNIQSELEKVREDIPKYKKQSEAAEVAKEQVLDELYSTKKLVDELKDSLEKTKTEEAQAKQDSELAQLRVREMEQGISDVASAAAKAQLEVSKSRHEAAIEELKSVKAELEVLQGDYHRLVSERDLSIRRAEEAVSVAKDAEKKSEDLALELITIKEALESSHALHLEAEERRIGIATTRDQDSLIWEKELQQAKKELQQLSDQQLYIEDLKSKLETASTRLLNLKTELAFFMEGRLMQDSKIVEEETETNKTEVSVTSELASAKKELGELKTSIEKTKDEVNCLREASSSLKAELDRETEAITTLRQREAMTSVTVSSLEAELSQMQSELEQVLTKEKESREKMEELQKDVQQATLDADQAKSVAQLACEELTKAKEEAEQVKASVSTTERRLVAALKEIETAKASEALAIAAVKAMLDSEQKKDEVVTTETVTVQLEEYYSLSKRAYDAEVLANERVISAVEEIKEAKNSKRMKLEKLEEAYKELEEKKEALKVAMEAAEKANEGKLAAEQELRDWRAENEQRRRESDATAAHLEKSSSGSPSGSSEDMGEKNMPARREAPCHVNSVSCPDLYDDNLESESKPRRKKSFFPRIVMFLARKKVQTLKKDE